MSTSGTDGTRANPFSRYTINGYPNITTDSGVSNEVASLILSYLPIGEIKSVMDSLPSAMNVHNVYRGFMGDAHYCIHNEHAKSSYTGKELEQLQSLLSLEGQALINGQPSVTKSWAELLAKDIMALNRLKTLDLSDSPNVTDADLIVLTKSSPNLIKLVLPGAFPSNEVMAELKVNCPGAAIYPSAMTEHEWAHPAEFMGKLPPPPQEVTDFINGLRPQWPGKTAIQAHMVMPRVGMIVRNSMMVPWTLRNIDALDRATGGPGCYFDNLRSVFDNPSKVGFEWIVFTKDVLPQSRNQIYDAQKQLTEDWGYEMPGCLDAMTSVLWENRITGNRIYDQSTFTRCKEKIGQGKSTAALSVGSFISSGAYVGSTCDHNSNIGVGGLRVFKI